MLLPQSNAYHALKARLASVSPLASLTVGRDSAAPADKRPDLDTRALLEQFQTTQKKHQALRKQAFRKQSLLRDDEKSAA